MQSMMSHFRLVTSLMLYIHSSGCMSIIGLITTHRITGRKMSLVERVLDGSCITWASLMLEGIYEQLGFYTGGACSF